MTPLGTVAAAAVGVALHGTPLMLSNMLLSPLSDGGNLRTERNASTPFSVDTQSALLRNATPRYMPRCHRSCNLLSFDPSRAITISPKAGKALRNGVPLSLS
eukprot:816163-Amphidinium_carterae.2